MKKSNETKMQHDAGKIAKMIKTAPLRARSAFTATSGQGQPGAGATSARR